MQSALVGRDRDLRAVVDACTASAPLVVIAGVAGIGKSRLREEAERHLATLGWRIATVAGSLAAQHIPLGALASLLPEETPASEALLIGQILRTLVGTDDRPLLLSVDDVHLLDPVSLTCLAQCARQGHVVLATLRVDEPLSAGLRELLTAPGVHRLDLEPLSAHDTAALAELQLRGPLAAPARSRVVETAGGNPLLLRELLADAQGAGALRRTPDGFALDGDFPVGARVGSFIDRRTERLDDELRRLLDLVAVAEPVAVDLLGPGVSDGLDRLERAELVRLDPIGGTWTVRTSHPLVGEAVRTGMRTARRLATLRRLCTGVTATTVLPPGAAVVAAGWFEELGTPFPAQVAAAAAWEALVSFDLGSARRLAGAAAATHWRAAFVLAEVARWRGDDDEAAEHLTHAARLAPDDGALRRVAMAHSALEAWQRGDPRAAIAVLDRAAQQARDPLTAEFLLCEGALLATLLGEFDAAIAASRRLLRRTIDDPLTRWNATINLGYAQTMLGETDGLAEVLATARTTFDAVRREQPEGIDLLAAVEAGLDLHCLPASAASASVRRRLAELGSSLAHRGTCAAISCEVLLGDADPGAGDLAALAVEQLQSHDPYGSLALALGYAALVAGLTGDRDICEARLAEARRASPDVRSAAVLARADAALTAYADPDEAGRLAFAGGREAIVSSHITLGVAACLESLAYSPDPDRAAFLADACLGRGSPLLGAIHAVATALADGDARAVGAASGGLARQGGRYLAALGLVAAARTCDDAVLRRRLAGRAGALLHDRPLATAPVLWTPPDGLSVRELEVALAAAEGLTNREIARQLFLSARTVGNHLYNVYDKLGLSGRTEIAAGLVLEHVFE